MSLGGIIGLVVVSVAFAAVLATHQSHATNCNAICQSRATSAAVWYALHELDCDDSDVGDAPCVDDLDLVNKAPLVERVTESKGNVVAHLTVYGKGGVISREALSVDRVTGQVIGDQKGVA